MVAHDARQRSIGRFHKRKGEAEGEEGDWSLPLPAHYQSTYLSSFFFLVITTMTQVEYTPTVAGNYSLLVTIGSTAASKDLGYYTVEESLATSHIQGSPFFLQVAPAPMFGPTTYATGSAMFSTTAGERRGLGRRRAADRRRRKRRSIR